MKRNLMTAALLLLAASLWLTGCSGPGTNSQPNNGLEQEESGQQPPVSSLPEGEISSRKPADYFPLTQSSTWEYQGEGNEYASFTREVLFTEGSLAQVREDNGGTVSASIFRTTEDEVMRIFFQGENYERNSLLDRKPNDSSTILKSPLQVGNKWNTPSAEREIVDVRAQVDTPAGEFKDCIKVKIASEDSTLFEYYHYGVGMVKREFISPEAPEAPITSSLQKFDIKPGS